MSLGINSTCQKVGCITRITAVRQMRRGDNQRARANQITNGTINLGLILWVSRNLSIILQVTREPKQRNTLNFVPERVVERLHRPRNHGRALAVSGCDDLSVFAALVGQLEHVHTGVYGFLICIIR